MSLSANAYSGMTHLQDPSDFADDGYGSLMGGGGAKKKKKPVLVLDADELEQAHQAIAMGGQTIMEAEDEPEAMERIRMPSSMLGLAPMGGDAEEDEADYGLSDEDAQDFADQEPEEYSEQGLSEEEEMEEDTSSIDVNFDHLLRPATRKERDPDDEESIPSIEEQLKKMRALPIQSEEEPAEAEASFDPEPEQNEPVAFQPEDAEPFNSEPEALEPLQSEPEPEEPVSLQPEDVDPLHTEPEQLEPQPFQPEAVEPAQSEPDAVEPVSVEPEGGDLQDLPEAAEQEIVPDAPIPADEVQPELDAGDWSAPEAEAEHEPQAAHEPDVGPETVSETEESWRAPEISSEMERDAEQAWDAIDEDVQSEMSDEAVSELPEVEWTPQPLEVHQEIAEKDAPEEDPLAEQVEPAIAEEADTVEADSSPAFEEDQWETPEAEWPQPETEQGETEDPAELAIPAIEEAKLDEEAPLSFAEEDVEEVEAFVPESVPEPEPELPPAPRNSLRARVYQMEEDRHTRGASLLGRIWNRLFGR